MAVGDSIPTGPQQSSSNPVLPLSGGTIPDELGLHSKTMFQLFLETFTTIDPNSTDPLSSSLHNESELAAGRPYRLQAAEMRTHDKTTMYIDYTHLALFSQQICEAICLNYLRLEPYLEAAIEEFIRLYQPEHNQFKKRADHSFHLSIYNLPLIHTIRDLKTAKIGQLISISGTVTRTSQVRPELGIAAFYCLDCNTLNKTIAQQFKYTEPQSCINPTCENTSKWELDSNNSIFQDWQSVKIQENSSEIPPGSMPRGCKVILRNEIVEQAKPGDKCTFTGTLIVVPDVAQLSSRRPIGAVKLRNNSNSRSYQENVGVSGLKSLGVRDLSYSLCFLANSVKGSSSPLSLSAVNDEQDFLTISEAFTIEEREKILAMSKLPRLFTRMANSIAPNIFGHEEIKRGLLLMLMGGVHKLTPDGANLRGDINVCIVGDPSTSKSQFLKYICTFLPRAVYTSGKASSAAGLTASVARDIETGEFGIEAGALMLADNSICCIDEFDKMDINDQVAIHEAMEQQTISIAKAGIQATLNARTSVLAAANPIKGRYDKSKTLKQNVDISAPIMSRFDLFFVVLDEQDEAVDYSLAKHIVSVHSNKPTALAAAEFTMIDLQNYIKFARAMKPKISEAARKIFVDQYIQLRANDSTGVNKIAYRITVRQLESLIRLSEARARVDLSEEVTTAHVQQAAQLLKMSIVRVEAGEILLQEESILDENDQEELNDGEYQPDDNEAGDEADNAAETEFNEQNNLVQNDPITPGAIIEEPVTTVETTNTVELSFSEYERIALLMVHYMRQQESLNKPYLTQRELIEWYLSSRNDANELQTVGDIEAQYRLITLIVQRLIKTDHVLIVVKDAVITEAEKEADRIEAAEAAAAHTEARRLMLTKAAKKADQSKERAEIKSRKIKKKLEIIMRRVIMVHPNYSPVDGHTKVTTQTLTTEDISTAPANIDEDTEIPAAAAGESEETQLVDDNTELTPVPSPKRTGNKGKRGSPSAASATAPDSGSSARSIRSRKQ